MNLKRTDWDPKYLKIAMNARKISPEDLSFEVDMNESDLRLCLGGYAKPTQYCFERLAEVLGCDAQYLISGTNVADNDGSLDIKVRFLSDVYDGELLPADGNKSDWIDLRSAASVTPKAGQSLLIPLGLAMQLPDGYEAHIVPRSSTFRKWGIIQTNHMGVIDNAYCGDEDQWMMPVYATRDAEIERGDRICQFRVAKKQPPLKFVACETLGNPNRGGFGSTGTK